MKRSYLNPPLEPRKVGILRVVLVVRISGPNQDIKSLEDQKRKLLLWLKQYYDGSVRILVISSRGKGELLGTPELKKLRRIIRKGKADLILMEDLGRMLRRLQALDLCEKCEDSRTRLIALNDNVDTFQEGWRGAGLFAVYRHEQSNRDTSNRIKRTLQNRFLHGEVIQTVIAGYIKPPRATCDSQIQVDPGAREFYEQAFAILEDGGSYSEVADYFNSAGFSTGPSCRTKQWSCAMVARVIHNPILKGVRERNRKTTKRENRSGKYRCIKAPPEALLTRQCPHLMIIDAERYDRVIAMLAERNAKYRRKQAEGTDPLLNRPKKKTVWPGQHLHCACCGGLLVYGAHGQKDRLVCTNAREYRCWQSVSIDASVARQKITEAISKEIESMSDFTEEVRKSLEEARLVQNTEAIERTHKLDRWKAELAGRVEKVRKTMEEAGPTPFVLESMKRLEEEQAAVDREADQVRRLESVQLSLPSLKEIQEGIRSMLDKLLTRSPSAVRLLRRMVPRIVVRPFQLLDGNTIVLRAEFTLDLAGGWNVGVQNSEHLRRRLVVDLFDPVQREQIRSEVIRLRGEGVTEREIATRLGVTVTAAQRAAALQRLIDRLGVSSAYRELTDPPPESRLRRHRHPRFRQEGDNQASA